jgi:hypothetical protein
MPSLGAFGTAGTMIGMGARAVWASPYGKLGLAGAALGGTYGAFSNNTSVMGGAFKGAALGMAVRPAVRGARAGMGMYNMARGMGMGRGVAAWQGLAGVGRGSAALIGNTANRALGRVSSYLPRFAGG